MAGLADRFFPELKLGGFSRLDGTVAFYARVQALLRPGGVVLDIGCGRGAQAADPVAYRRALQDLRGGASRVIGIDVDPEAAENPLLNEFRRIEGERWPIDDDSIDLAVANYVLEHVERPAAFFRECRRTLREGGILALRTSNAWGYPALAARVIPNRLHARVVRRVHDGSREERDVFPTVYRCNSLGRLRRALEREGFEHAVWGVEADPSYLHFSSIAYRLGLVWQRVAPGGLSASLVAFGRLRKGGATGG